jgi:hypothetical protein
VRARVRRPTLWIFSDTVTADVRVEDAGVRVGDRLVERAAIENAAVLPARSGVWLRLKVRGEGRFDIGVADVGEGRRLLAALRLHPAQRTGRYAVPSTAISGGCLAMLVPLVAFSASVVLAIVLASALHSAAPIAIPVVALCVVLGFMLSPAKLVVDDAGVHFTWMGKTRHVPRETIQRAEVYDEMVESTYRDSDRDERTRKVRSVGLRIVCTETIDVPMYLATDRGRDLAELIVERIQETIGPPAVTDPAAEGQ